MSGTTAAVIGAGMAGMSCAHALREAGWEVRLFDKGRGPGGRVATRRAEGYRFDHGPQYFRARSKPFVEVVQRWQAEGVVAPWRPRARHIDADGIRTKIDVDGWLVGTPTMSAIGRRLASGLTISLNSRIVQVRKSPEGWQLQAENGTVAGPFDYLIVSCPAPQSARFLRSLSPLYTRAESAIMLPCFATMARFDEAIDAGAELLQMAEGCLALAARDASKPGRAEAETWVLHASFEWTQENLEMPKEEVATALLARFSELLGQPLSPVWQAGHRWLYSKPADPLDAPCYVDLENRVGLAGDWCNKANMEGAFLSGRALANRLLR